MRKTWQTAEILLCTFHFLQNIWRWLLNIKHGIHCDERQILMNLVRKLVYAKTEAELITEYSHFEKQTLIPTFLIIGFAEKNGLCVLKMQRT